MKISICLALLIFLGCAPKISIDYDATDIGAKNSRIPGSLNIETFKDERNPNGGSNRDGMQCVNSEMHYYSDSVALQTTRCIYNHLLMSRVFDTVLFNSQENYGLYFNWIS
jgi:hypothetical protein